MKELILESKITSCQIDELTNEEHELIEAAIEATKHSYFTFLSRCGIASVKRSNRHRLQPRERCSACRNLC